jgi:hypothetical protein
MSEQPEPVCTATLAPYGGGPLKHCSREPDHYDEAVEPTFGDDGWTKDVGGWHITAGSEPTVWADWADGATPHGVGLVRPGEEPTT